MGWVWGCGGAGKEIPLAMAEGEREAGIGVKFIDRYYHFHYHQQ